MFWRIKNLVFINNLSCFINIFGVGRLNVEINNCYF